MAIFHGYMDGQSATDTHALMNATPEVSVSISRQAIEGIYLRLGNYLWTEFVRNKMEKLYYEYKLGKDCESFSHFIAYYLDMVRQAINGDLEYTEYRKDGVEIGNMGTVKLLHERSQKFKGLPSKTFHCHFAFVSFMDTMNSEIEAGRFSFDNVKIMLLREFEKTPL